MESRSSQLLINTIKKCEVMISKGNTSEVFQLLKSLETDHLNKIILLSGRFENLKNKEIEGIITNAEKQYELNEINSSTLNLIDKIRSENDLNKTSNANAPVIYSIKLAGNFKDFNKERIGEIILELMKCTNDFTIEYKEIKEGSVIISLKGTTVGFAKVKTLFEGGKLNEIIEEEVQEVDLMEASLKAFMNGRKYNASRIRNSLEKYKEQQEVKHFLTQFNELHNEFVKYLLNADIQSAMRIYLDIYTESQKLTILENERNVNIGEFLGGVGFY